MQISRMFPEELSWRHAVNIPLLPADVEQHWCPRVTHNGSFRWSLLYYTTDILQTLFPRMCESCRGGCQFYKQSRIKQCIPKENTGCKELPFAAAGYVCVAVLHRAGSSSQHCFPLPNPCAPVAGSQRAAFPWMAWSAFVNPSEGECFSHSDSSKPNILWRIPEEFGFSSPLSFVVSFPLGKVFACCLKTDNKLIFDAAFGLGMAKRSLFFWRDISRFL